MPGHADFTPRAGNRLLLLGEFTFGYDSLRACDFELLRRGSRVELLGRDGPIGQDCDNVARTCTKPPSTK